MNKIKGHWTAVGSREITHVAPHLKPILATYARIMEDLGYVLRSGAAVGSDAWFEAGVRHPSMKEIYLHKKGASGHPSELYGVCDEALRIASIIRGGFGGLGNEGRMLHARNVYQVLGKDIKTPSKFLICWTFKGQKVGGTRTAIRLAENYNIPVLNLGAVENYQEALENFLFFVIGEDLDLTPYFS